MKVPFITLVILGLALLSLAVPTETVWAQNAAADGYYEAEGLLNSVSGDIAYIKNTPFRLTGSTRIFMPAGYEVNTLIFEEDLIALVQYIPDEATGGRDIPQALLIRLTERPPQ